ncbi:site-specific DNA-methyltransferase [Salinarimonas sp. NSM]|uniref:site-specific DNA-methyltransferase n=1 Tax=Salinarimonas sp. NSM TaxID=3458003 RepID=UPI0040374DF8
MARTPKGPTRVETLAHEGERRTNIPTAEHQSFALAQEAQNPVEPARFERARPLAPGETRERDGDRDPQIVWNGARIRLSKAQIEALVKTGEVAIGDAQLVWRGKDAQDWSDLVVEAPPLYIQEKIHPKAIIQDLMRRSKAGAEAKTDAPDLFADFNGLPDPEARLEFYQHEQHWTNRMILGDSLQVMASLAQREALKGKVQAIYFDPPYGIKFNSNWQVSTLSRDVKDGKATDITREPEQVKAFRDTWKDGIHSYLTYLRDRLTVARELLTESGSIFVQIGDENVHRVRAVMDEVFGEECFVVNIVVKKKGSQISNLLEAVNDHIIWYSKSDKNSGRVKFRPLFNVRENEEIFETYNMVELEAGERLSVRELSERDGTDYASNYALLKERYPGSRLFALNPMKSGGFRRRQSHPFKMHGRVFPIGDGQCWKHTVIADDGETPGMTRLERSGRLYPLKNDVRFVRYAPEPPISRISNWWDSLGGASNPVYVVQTNTELVKRCILMTTDPGDIVLDPTCGSGTTAYVAEHWGRRWITIDTSRVALALTRARLMSASFPFFILKDSAEGARKELELGGSIGGGSHRHDVKLGFVYERARWQTSGSIANNAKIDVIWERWHDKIDELLIVLNEKTGSSFEEWEVPARALQSWSEEAIHTLIALQEALRARKGEMDAVVAETSELELLYDRPYEDKGRVRVAGPFTVESLSPHRVAPADDLDDELIDEIDAEAGRRVKRTGGTPPTEFATMVIEHLRTAGVHQHAKSDTIRFTSLQGWPGEWIGAAGTFAEGAAERRAAIFIGPEFGTVTRAAIVAAAREATDARFDVLIVCAFAFDAHAAEVQRMGPMPVLQARMNPDLHMAEDLKNTGKGNLFVVFGEPDVEVEDAGEGLIRVRVHGVDVFDPNTGQIRSDGVEGVAAWFVDDDYDEESFFVRQAYFLGAQDPFKALKSALKSEVDEEAWGTLYSAVSRDFARPKTGRIAVKVINHFGDEVMRILQV